MKEKLNLCRYLFWQHFLYFYEEISLHVLTINLPAHDLTTEFMMLFRLWSIDQKLNFALQSHMPSRHMLRLQTFCLSLP